MMRNIVIGALLLTAAGIAGLVATLGTANVNGLHEAVTRQLEEGGDPFRSITVISPDTDVVIAPAQQKAVTAELLMSRPDRADLFDLKLSERGGAVTVRVERKDPHRPDIGSLLYREKVEIRIPAGRYELLRAETESADIGIADVEGDRVIAMADKGDIRIEGRSMTGGIRAESGQGDVTVVFDENPSSLQLSFAAAGSGSGTVDWTGLDYSKQAENRLIGRSGAGKYRLDVKVGDGRFHAALKDGEEKSGG